LAVLLQLPLLDQKLKKLTAVKDLPPVVYKKNQGGEALSDLNNRVTAFNSSKSDNIDMCKQEIE